MSSSSTSAAASLNGSNAHGVVSSASRNPTGGRPQMKITSGKGADASRKQTGSPIDGAQRKPPNAWAQNSNPITQRPATFTGSNGAVNIKQASSHVPGETSSPRMYMHYRMLPLFAQLTGYPANITLKNGQKFTGVLSGVSLDPSELRYVFKMVKRVQSADTSVNGAADVTDEYDGEGDSYVKSFDIIDVADLHIPNVTLDKGTAKPRNGISSGFRTDTDISGNFGVRERELQRWQPSAGDNVELSLDSAAHNASSEWDQFAENEKITGMKSDYDETIYTTVLDRNHPEYKQREAVAERLAREIESSSALTAHVLEERGKTVPEDGGVDEEEKYSGVRRDFPPLPSGQPNKYTPPARRAPTSQPTVLGAPVDPAIISSQIARPSSTSSKPAPVPVVAQPGKPTDAESSKPDQAPKPETAVTSKGEAPKDTASKPIGKVPAVQPADQVQRPGASQNPVVPGLPHRRPENASSNVEHELLNQFKQFSANEKLRISERQRSLARETKAVKMNDLKKFSQNFKLHTPIPNDLVPILAKDPNKQQQIVEKALQNVREVKSTPPKPAAAPVDPKAARPSPAKADATQNSPSGPADRPNNQRPRPGPNHYSSGTVRNDRPGPNHTINQSTGRAGGPPLLTPRLTLNQQQHKAGAATFTTIPHPIPAPDARLPPTGPSASSSGVQTPQSAISTRFNVRAPDFKPNPAASTFLPGGNTSTGSSPRPNSAAKSEPRKVPVTSFFGAQRPTPSGVSVDEGLNVIKRMLNESPDETKKPEVAKNGGLPVPFWTMPTWDFPEANAQRGYLDMFGAVSAPPQVSAPPAVMNNGPVPHQHQVPHHLQHGPQGFPQNPTPQHTPRHPNAQPHHVPGNQHQFEAHHMQFSQSTSSVHPSPRAMPHYMYPGHPQAIPTFPQQPMQAYGMSSNMPNVPMRPHGGPQFVNGPAPAMGGQLMTNQPSNGPFMAVPVNPQMQMYTPGPNPAFPHFPGQMTGPPGANGFPSPRPVGAQMMTHQGSQQGHQPQMVYVQPHSAQGPPMFPHMPMPSGPMTQMRGPYPQAHQPPYSSPHQPHPFPQQPHRGTPSAGYSQPMMQQHSLPPQGPPPAGPVGHGPEGGDEGK